MEFSILGSLEVRRNGAVLPVSRAKERLLLVALLTEPNRVVAAERLVELLWAGDPPASAGNTLQTYISHLRRVLEPDRRPGQPGRLLQTRDPGYLLSVEPAAIDTVRFERLADRGRAAVSTDPRRAAHDLQAALDLWRGEPLVDVRFEPFAQAEIARLCELRTAAFCDRVDADLALGRDQAVCAELTRAVDEHPLHERLWGQLILARYRAGRQAEAVHAFGELRSRLAEQLGVDPGAELVRLHEAVLTASPDLELGPTWANPVPAGGSGAGAGSGHPAPDDPLTAGRKAVTAHAWQRAYELLAAVDADGELSGEDLDGLAEAAFYVGDYRESLTVRQRAYQAFRDEGQLRRAAHTALVLALHHGGRRRLAVAGGWFNRAQRLLGDEPDCVEQGYLILVTTLLAIDGADYDAALDAADRAHAAGRRFGSDALQACGLVCSGQVLVRQGEVGGGQARMDEAMAMAVGGRLSPFATGLVFCRTIRTCYELGDYRRAGEWTEAIDECAERTGLSGFPGDCEAHRVVCLAGAGAWQGAELEARHAAARAERADLTHVGLAFHAIGDIRLRVGDLEAAAQAYDKAEELGECPLPGRARLALERGDPVVAAAVLAEGLAAREGDRLGRSRLLPDRVTACLAIGDRAAARSAAAELSDAARLFASPALCAAADTAHASLALAGGGDHATEDPVPLLRRSARRWTDAGSPYESGSAQALLAAALRRQGRPDAARRELAAAHACFDRLGASWPPASVVALAD